MKNARRVFLGLVILSLGFVSGVGCWSVSAKKAFVFRLIAEPETLDWNRAHTPLETYLLMNLMEGLVSLRSDLKIQPALAESWKISPDGLTYLFQLRSGLRWSDGRSVRASDFVFSWKRLLTASTGASYSYLLFDIENAKEFFSGTVQDFNQVGVHALDDRLLEVKLRRPRADWIYVPSFWVTFPIRQDLVEKYPSNWTQAGKLVTLGPFVLVSHQLDSKIELKRNRFYYKDQKEGQGKSSKSNSKAQRLDEVTALIVGDDSTAVNLFRAGRLDFLTDISNLVLGRIKENSAGLGGVPGGLKDELKIFNYLKTVYLGMVVHGNGSDFPTENTHFRKAVAMALDKSRLKNLIQSEPTPASTFIPPGLPGYFLDRGLHYNLAQAKKELAMAGGPPKNGVSLLIPSFEKPMVIGQWIQMELEKNLGIQVRLEAFDFSTYRRLLDERRHALFLSSWSADFPTADNFLSVFASDSGNNRTGWKNRNYDGILDKMRAENSPKLYEDLQELLLEKDAVVTPLYYEANPALVRSGFINLELSPVNYLYLGEVEKVSKK